MLPANPTLLPGIDIVIGGKTYVAPALNLGGIRAVLPKIGAVDVNWPDLVACVLTVSLKRNYPEADQRWLEETLEGGEFARAKELIPELLRRSGLGQKEAAPGEPAAAGSATFTG